MQHFYSDLFTVMLKFTPECESIIPKMKIHLSISRPVHICEKTTYPNCETFSPKIEHDVFHYRNAHNYVNTYTHGVKNCRPDYENCNNTTQTRSQSSKISHSWCEIVRPNSQSHHMCTAYYFMMFISFKLFKFIICTYNYIELI